MRPKTGPNPFLEATASQMLDGTSSPHPMARPPSFLWARTRQRTLYGSDGDEQLTRTATSPRRGIQILRPPLPPLLDRIRVLWIVPVRIEAEAMAEAGVATELILGNAFDEVEQSVVNVLLAPEHLTQR
jgi:hypothetical protein